MHANVFHSHTRHWKCCSCSVAPLQAQYASRAAKEIKAGPPACSVSKHLSSGRQNPASRPSESRTTMSQLHIKQWSHGLCGCFSDCSTCVVAYLCPCYIFGKTAEKVGGNKWLCGLSQCVPLLNMYAQVNIRKRVRDKMMMTQGTLMNDIAVAVFCPYCGIVQEARELTAIQAAYMARE